MRADGMSTGSMKAFRRAVRKEARRTSGETRARTRLTALAGAVVLCVWVAPAFAQAQRADTTSDANDARTDAMFAMPNLSSSAPLSNLYATAPGLETQIPAPRLGVNLLLPLGWDSNPAQVQSGA